MTAYSPVLLKQAGYSAIKQNGLAGGLNTIGIIGTIISAQIVDRLGRRKCLMWGAAGLCAVNLIVSLPFLPVLLLDQTNHYQRLPRCTKFRATTLRRQLASLLPP